MFQQDSFKDKVVLVTGGRSGIGYQIAKDFLLLGAKVIICSRKADKLKVAAEALSEFGKIEDCPCDIRQTEQIQKLADYIKEEFGKLDILINNAGGQFPAMAEHINDKGWNAVINNNLNGTFFMTREMGFPGMVHTGAARAGVENLTKTLAQEWSDFNIRINCVAPGIIESSGLETYPKPIQDMFEQAKKAIPLKRFGTVQDVSNSVIFLSSPMAAYITGISLYVDGAQHLNYNKMGLIDTIKSFG